MTDGEAVAIARRIDELKQKIDDLINKIIDSDHPNAQAMYDDLMDQCWFGAWATHVVHGHLAHPERWEAGNHGVRRKSA